MGIKNKSHVCHATHENTNIKKNRIILLKSLNVQLCEHQVNAIKENEGSQLGESRKARRRGLSECYIHVCNNEHFTQFFILCDSKEYATARSPSSPLVSYQA